MALVQYDKALRLDSTQTRVRYKMGRLLLKKGLPKEALQAFQEIVQRDANYALAHEAIGEAFFRMGNFAEAEKSLRHAITLDQQLWQSYNFFGILHDRSKRFNAAIAAYQMAITLQPDQELFFNNL
jgi:Flp pilus assembly protein TadD